MTDDIDIWRVAKLLVNRHRADAPLQAGIRADALLERGDMDGHAVWLRVVTAVDTLLRDRGDHETLH